MVCRTLICYLPRAACHIPSTMYHMLYTIYVVFGPGPSCLCSCLGPLTPGRGSCWIDEALGKRPGRGQAGELSAPGLRPWVAAYDLQSKAWALSQKGIWSLGGEKPISDCWGPLCLVWVPGCLLGLSLDFNTVKHPYQPESNKGPYRTWILCEVPSAQT